MSFSALRRSPWFALAALTITFSVGFVDRQILNLLVQPIKADFGLSDLEISLLQGAAFSIAYLIMSPVFGRWVDVSGRRRILLGCIAVWSVFTAACGFTRSFGALFAARSGVGAAEAGLTPSSWSLLSDLFDEKRLARALSIYNMGPYIGSGLALLLGGVVIEWATRADLSAVPVIGALAPWQITFVIVSTLGLVCIAMVAAMREPPRGAVDPGQTDSPPPLTLGEALSILWAHRGFYGYFYIGMALAIIPIYAFPAWLPTVAIRQYGVSIGQVGMTYGLLTLVGGSLGVLTGPTLGRWLARAGYPDANMRLGVISALAVFACCAALLMRSGYEMVLAIGGIISFCYSIPTAMAATALQVVTPNRMRGLASSLYIVLVTLMGLGIAPVTVAFLTDKVFRDELRVGDSLGIVCAISALLSCGALWLSLKAYRRLILDPIRLA
ncbi:MFS transporter [Novosphingobium sp. P6W]|uniref:MFS transporter n=1 Tax=Novosphingobium sp. P6W TaxID=1609758 RepID=UPI0005C729CD|nr:MFS transporter [Novosphingobium sp. P6W]AXB78693.1 MFS transporter [Novosphingobium sp. P6W]